MDYHPGRKITIFPSYLPIRDCLTPRKLRQAAGTSSYLPSISKQTWEEGLKSATLNSFQSIRCYHRGTNLLIRRFP